MRFKVQGSRFKVQSPTRHPAPAPHPDFFVHRRYDFNEVLPWDFIDHSVSKHYLWVEWRKALLERQTPPCDVTTCHSCQAC